MKLFLLFLLILITVTNVSAQQKETHPGTNSINQFIEGEKKGFALLTGNKNNLTVASTNFDINYYRCEFRVDPAVRFISGKVTSYFTITQPTDTITFDLSDTLSVDSIIFRGSAIYFQRDVNDGLRLTFPSMLNTGQQDSVSIYYKGVPRLTSSYQAFVETVHDNVPVLWTLSEPFGAKEWWPCKNGLDDKADSIDVIITNPDIYQASSNGILMQESDSNNMKTSFWKHRYPIASYLVAFGVTNFIVQKDTTTVNGKVLNLVNYTYPEYTDYFNSQILTTKFVLNLFTNLFEAYPFANEKYGFTEINGGGGMEHQTNSFIGNPSPDLIAHETMHQWFGDKITCGSWHDIFLNEGFATYGQFLYYENTDKNATYSILKNVANDVTSLPDGSVWVDDTTSADRVFSGRLTYHKGFYMLHMLRWILGDSVFFKGIQRYLDDPLLKYNFARAADLQRNLELESGKDLSSFFQKWFYQQGYPSYSVSWMQDSTNLLYVKLSQTTSHPSVSFFDMPVPVEFKNSINDTTIVFNNIQNGQTFLANPGFKADTAIFDPLFWILSAADTTIKLNCNSVTGNSLFPYYNIQWSQNSNNWSHVEITQTNELASSTGENIQLYLHFSNDGNDTAFLINNIKYTYNNWLNIGFKATNVYVTTSCFMNMNYSLTGQTNNSVINDIKIFPVPVTNDVVNISLKNPSDRHLAVSVFNALGQLISHANYDTPGKDELFSIALNKTAAGTYFVRLKSDSKINITRKIVKYLP